MISKFFTWLVDGVGKHSAKKEAMENLPVLSSQ